MKSSGLFILSTIGSFIITHFVKVYFTNKTKESPRYQSILQKRDAELSNAEQTVNPIPVRIIAPPVPEPDITLVSTPNYDAGEIEIVTCPQCAQKIVVHGKDSLLVACPTCGSKSRLQTQATTNPAIITSPAPKNPPSMLVEPQREKWGYDSKTKILGGNLARVKYPPNQYECQHTSRDKDELYRQARVVFDRLPSSANAAIFSSFKIFKELADQSYGKAYYPLSILYRKSNNPEESQVKARHYTKNALNWCITNQANQDVELWCDLGSMYEAGEDIPEDLEEAVKWYRLAAEQGNARGQIALGYMYQLGKGVPEDLEEAVKWYRLAAEQGDAQGQNCLGHMYQSGEGVDIDYDEAVKWYRLAAEQGFAWGQYSLGSMYKSGNGVPRDYDEAVKWYRLAAAQGFDFFKNELANMYYYQIKDYDEAVKWYQMAAEQGNVDAQCFLNKLGIDWKK